jgi:hypothetical protein
MVRINAYEFVDPVLERVKDSVKATWRMSKDSGNVWREKAS